MLSRRILAAVAVLCALAVPAYAQSTKAQINTEITTTFIDNNVGAITPAGLRTVTSDIVNSIMPTAPVVTGNLACFSGTTGLLQDCGISPSVIYQTVSGDVTINAAGVATVTSNFLNAAHAWGATQTLSLNQNAATSWSVSNSSAGAASTANLLTGNGSNNGIFGVGGLGNTSFSNALQNRAYVYSSSGAAGIAVFADGANPINFYNNGTLSGAFSSAGIFSLTTPLAASSGGTGLSALGAGCATWLGTPSSANLRGCVTDETGTGLLYFQGGDIGTPSAGNGSNLTSLNATQLTSGTIAPGRTNGHQNGTATNDAAAAGEIGEYVESVIIVGSATALTTTVAKTVTSISLTAGDWDVGTTLYFLSGGNVTNIVASISGTTNTLDTTPGKFAQLFFTAVAPGSAAFSQSLPAYRLSLSGTTTVFAVAQAAFTVSGSAYGIIRARRVR